MNRFGPKPATAASIAVQQPPLQGLSQAQGPTRLVRWALYGFVFSLPFDAPNRLPLELTTMTGALYLAATLWQWRLCYGRQPAALWWFLAYLYIYWLAHVLGDSRNAAGALKSFLFYLQGILIFWSAFNLMRYEGVTKRLLITLVIAVAVLAIMTVLGIGKAVDSETQRAMVFGQNGNRAARVLCAGLLTVVSLIYGRPKRVLRPSWIGWACAALIGLAMIMGGSRGGLLALVAGLWTFALFGSTVRQRVRNILVATIALGLAGWGAWQSPLMQRRIQLGMQGNLAKREVIWPVAWQMFKDSPWVGWGPSNQTVLAVRLRLSPQRYPTRDTHNLFLEVLTATGVLGALPFCLGIWLCCWSAWKARRGSEGSLPTAQMAALLVGNLSGNYIALKLQWLLLAYAAASYTYLTAKVVRPTIPQAAAARRRRWA